MNNQDSEKNVVEPWWQAGLQLFFTLSGWIVGPVIAAVLLGKFLDRKYHTEPWLFLATVGISFVISMVILIKIGFKEFRKIEKQETRNKKQ